MYECEGDGVCVAVCVCVCPHGYMCVCYKPLSRESL